MRGVIADFPRFAVGVRCRQGLVQHLTEPAAAPNHRTQKGSKSQRCVHDKCHLVRLGKNESPRRQGRQAKTEEKTSSRRRNGLSFFFSLPLSSLVFPWRPWRLGG